MGTCPNNLLFLFKNKYSEFINILKLCHQNPNCNDFLNLFNLFAKLTDITQ